MTNKMKLSKTTETRGPRHPPHSGGCCHPKTSHGAGGGQPGRCGGGGGRAPTRIRRGSGAVAARPKVIQTSRDRPYLKGPYRPVKEIPTCCVCQLFLEKPGAPKPCCRKRRSQKTTCFWKVCGCLSLAPQASRKSFGTQKHFAW